MEKVLAHESPIACRLRYDVIVEWLQKPQVDINFRNSRPYLILPMNTPVANSNHFLNLIGLF